MTRRHLLKSLLLLPFLPAVKLLPKPVAELGSYENPVPCVTTVRMWVWRFSWSCGGVTAYFNHEPTQDEKNGMWTQIPAGLIHSAWNVYCGPLYEHFQIKQTTECCKIISPWRVDAEQMTGVHVVSQPGRTRYQKQTDEALSIDRPTVWEG